MKKGVKHLLAPLGMVGILAGATIGSIVHEIGCFYFLLIALVVNIIMLGIAIIIGK